MPEHWGQHCSKENWRTKMKPRKATNDLRKQVLRQTVGCDKELNSDKVPDRCGRCGGLGTTCELKTANYTKDHSRYGFGNADTMLILKNGSSNIHVTKRGKTWNFIGIYLTNGVDKDGVN
ncbi:Hypothetical predicted protein [Paramuricea clavata]|uniref:Uncharacterized protein n=1 Tax=Paramuricea clavata TaxID=317549 RepID=A0A6S7JCE5_PARCT|nr:Hypothetical predicted protein [Paramuricea clavata]